ncbi:MAG TPA: DUF2911 domain-containing protein [Gemmatimonadaceae bacterium]|nr:DUF2911 domain-containing protein [Gemmatimonadaceae bacterium]
MKRFILAGLALAACGPSQPAERYGFIARLGNDTVSLESVVRRGNTLTSDGVDRFPRVRQRHTEVSLAPDGGIRRLVMDIVTPSEPADQRERHVVADVTADSVLMTKRDAAGSKRWALAHGREPVVAHVPQMYSLYEVYFGAALARPSASTSAAADTMRLRQFYIDREFDRFPLGHATVRRLPNNKAEIWHDWLSGVGEAVLDSSHRLLRYSGARTTYKVDVTRLSDPPNVAAVGAQFAALETRNGRVAQLSVRDTTRASIGNATFTVDYGRPLARGRQLLGDVVPYDYVWRTGANAATQFTTSAPITLAGITVPAGTYTLWTVPRVKGADLIVNKQSGQWGTEYDGARDLGMARMQTDTPSAPVERFTISIVGADARHGTLAMEWGPFRWTAPIVVASVQNKRTVKN